MSKKKDEPGGRGWGQARNGGEVGRKKANLGAGMGPNKMTLQLRKAYLYSQYLNHNIGFWARLCPSLLTFHQGPVKPRSLSEPHKILLVIYIPA